jgi:hypothetical protein
MKMTHWVPRKYQAQVLGYLMETKNNLTFLIWYELSRGRWAIQAYCSISLRWIGVASRGYPIRRDTSSVSTSGSIWAAHSRWTIGIAVVPVIAIRGYTCSITCWDLSTVTWHTWACIRVGSCSAVVPVLTWGSVIIYMESIAGWWSSTMSWGGGSTICC